MNVFPKSLPLLLLLALAACTPMPDFAAYSETANGPAPKLMPMDQLLAQAAAPTRAQAQAQDLSSRAARLRARAALMRGPVADPAVRARLMQAIAAGKA